MARAQRTNRSCDLATTSNAGSARSANWRQSQARAPSSSSRSLSRARQKTSRRLSQIVARGGRVLATGFWGGYLVPDGEAGTPKDFTFAACHLEPEGLDPLANSGEVWMVPEATWEVGNPKQRTQYGCAGQPAVVEYDYGKGHVVWWANSTPLENGSLARAHNFDLLLNSLGPREGHHFYWDESLHGDMRSNWSYVTGPTVALMWTGLILISILIVFSFSRRSGPVRDLPPPARSTPIEFLEALGSLYRNAGASSTAVTIAWERFRRYALRLCGLRQAPVSAEELAAAIRRRFPNADPSLEADLSACEDARLNEKIEPRAALKVIQSLHHHRQTLAVSLKAGQHLQSRSQALNPLKRKALMSEELRENTNRIRASSAWTSGSTKCSSLHTRAPN